jgi:hypothetical protein
VTAAPEEPRGDVVFRQHLVVSTLGGISASSVSRLGARREISEVVQARIGSLAVASNVPDYPEIPVEAVAVDPGSFAAAAGVADLAPMLRSGAVLSASSSTLRQVSAGGELLLEDGTRVPVSGVVEDAALGGHEVAVDAARGASLGVTRLAYLLVRAADDASPAAITAAIRQALPNQVLRIRTPGERPFARAGDEVLPQGPFKLMFGEFAVRRSGGGLVQDPAWAARNLVVADVPLLGRFRCHRRLVEILVPAMQELERRGLASTVDAAQFGGCYNVRAVRGASTLSRHAWGAAVDLNVGSNPLGAAPTIDRRIVDLLESRGLRWGGRFLRPDGQHFEGYGFRPAAAGRG